jgi:hypothetical protein
MQHPFIGKLDELSTQELSEKINDLYKKLRVATISGNGHLANQVRMAIESYETKYQERLREELGGDDNYQTNVDIS